MVRIKIMGNPFAARWANYTDLEWLSALLKSSEARQVDGVRFPMFPPVET